MSITVVCSSCSAKLHTPDSAAGKKVKCPRPSCGEIIAVPEAPAFEVVDDETEPQPKSAPRKSVKAVVETDEERPRGKRKLEDDDEEEERPRKRNRRAEEDEEDDDDRPSRRPAREEYEERPKRRKSRDDDYDDDDDEEPDFEPGRCPKCRSKKSSKVSYTWWGGIIGPAIFKMVRCNRCRTSYNRKTGRPISGSEIAIYTFVMVAIGAVIGFAAYFANKG